MRTAYDTNFYYKTYDYSLVLGFLFCFVLFFVVLGLELRPTR
jgi:hypothetical protein